MPPHIQGVRLFALALVAVIATAAIVIWTPPLIDLGLGILAAVFWCIWLERHPTAPASRTGRRGPSSELLRGGSGPMIQS